MANNNELITAQELADKLDLSVETIWKYTREDKIPYFKLGKRQYRYKLTDVISALDKSYVKEEKAEYKINSSKKYTYQDYLKLPYEVDYKIELLDGMLVSEPSPTVIHQRVSRRLQRILEDYIWEKDPNGEIFDAPLDTKLNETNVTQPDLLYVSGKQKEIIKEKCIEGSPLLLVEIISPYSGRKDRVKKMNIYRKNGVKHYWLVNPMEKTFECFVLEKQTCSIVLSGMDRDIIKHPNFKGLNIPLETLWPEKLQ